MLCWRPVLAPLSSSAPAATATKLNVVSTVSPVTNIIYNIGGDKIDLQGIVPEGVNSHTFEPAPSDSQKTGRGRYGVCKRPEAGRADDEIGRGEQESGLRDHRTGLADD